MGLGRRRGPTSDEGWPIPCGVAQDVGPPHCSLCLPVSLCWCGSQDLVLIPVWADICRGLRPHSSSWEMFGHGKPHRGMAGSSSALCCCGSLGHSCASCICSLMAFATTGRDLVRWCPQFAGPLYVPSPLRRLLPERLKSQPCWTSTPCFLSTSTLPAYHSPGFHWGWVWGDLLVRIPSLP